jgi:hypothetical protein
MVFEVGAVVDIARPRRNLSIGHSLRAGAHDVIDAGTLKRTPSERVRGPVEMLLSVIDVLAASKPRATWASSDARVGPGGPRGEAAAGLPAARSPLAPGPSPMRATARSGSLHFIPDYIDRPKEGAGGTAARRAASVRTAE